MNKKQTPQKPKTEPTILCGLVTHQRWKNVCAIWYSSMAQREIVHTFSKMHGLKGDTMALSLGRCSLQNCELYYQIN